MACCLNHSALCFLAKLRNSVVSRETECHRHTFVARTERARHRTGALCRHTIAFKRGGGAGIMKFNNQRKTDTKATNQKATVDIPRRQLLYLIPSLGWGFAPSKYSVTSVE